MLSVAVHSPAKINLFLAVTGARADGYHDLVSLVAPLRFGDSIWLRASGAPGAVRLSCDDPAVPVGSENLAVRAAEAFRRAARRDDGIEIELRKRTPMGAGLGGGSSNAAAVLRGLNALWGQPLSALELMRIAAELGSDCPLFLAGGACIVRGRGERLEMPPAAVRERLKGVRLLVFKPDFPIGTPWAFARLAAKPGRYVEPAAAESALADWMAGARPMSELLFNSFEPVAFEKFMVLPVLAEKLRNEPGVDGVLLSGSGSACFGLLSPRADANALVKLVREVLGPSAFVTETMLA